jgi:hypothetical protein
MVAVAAGDDTVLVASDRTGTAIAYQGDWLSADTKVRGSRGHYLATM